MGGKQASVICCYVLAKLAPENYIFFFFFHERGAFVFGELGFCLER